MEQGGTWRSPSVTTLQEEQTQADHVKDGNEAQAIQKSWAAVEEGEGNGINSQEK
jgi:hypothetical protein